MKKLVIFTGAGISKESGIPTFRDNGGLWDEYNVDDVATISGWHKNKKLVLEFYNKRRSELEFVEPNIAHITLAELEQYYDVQIITQNVDNLHERGGSTNVLHLHGELTKAKTEDNDCSIDINYSDISIGDNPIKFGKYDYVTETNQLRPDIVWFGESVPNMNPAYEAVLEADIFVVIGTSLQVYPAADLLTAVIENNAGAEIYIIDPTTDILPITMRRINYIEKVATEGSQILYKKLKDDLD